MKYKDIKTWEDACKIHNIDPEKLPDVSTLPETFQEHIVNYYKLVVITEAINTSDDGAKWTPDWSNYNEWKYFHWFEIDASEENKNGVGFSYSVCDSWHTGTNAGSRLCFSEKNRLQHAQKYFEDIYIKVYLIQ